MFVCRENVMIISWTLWSCVSCGPSNVFRLYMCKSVNGIVHAG